MPFNPSDENSVTRLREAMDWSKKKSKPFREHYIRMLEEYVGPYYGDSHSRFNVPINMLKMSVDIYQRSLTARNPRALVTTKNRAIRPQAKELQIATNEVIREVALHRTLREAVKQALFSIGVIKVGITAQSMGEAQNYLFDAGQPFADFVLFDDWLHDMTARRFEEVSWCGNRYRLPYDHVMECPMFDEAAKQKLRKSDGGGYQPLFDDAEHSSALSQGNDMGREEYEDHVDLWDIWLPRENLVVTLADDSDVPPLNVIEWDGPERGPYHLLYFSSVPGNLMPSPPISHLFDLHDLINKLFVKMGDQAGRQKTITLATLAASNDGTAEAIRKAEDGSVVSVQNPEAAKEFRWGGVDQMNAGFWIQLLQRFSYMAGNLDVLGGLSQQADTATQEQILKSASSGLVADMQDRVVEFTRDVVTDITWWVYHDPVTVTPLVMQLDGYDRDIPYQWGPDRREAPFFDFNFNIQPYSMQAMGPAERLTAIMKIIGEAIMPAVQTGQAQINWQELIGLIAEYADLPELHTIVSGGPNPMMLAQMMQRGGGGGGQPPKPPQTTRNYVRKNVPGGGTQASRDNVMSQQMMSGGKAAVSPQQLAAAGR